METITITLDGVAVSGRQGMTILELAREVDIRIPTLCDDPCLKPVGACRICLVEDESTGRLMASCVTPIAPGMQIQTRSATVIETRKVIVKLLIANHAESCILCDKGNRCQLRKLAADLGIGHIDYDRMPLYVELQDLNPFIQRDLSKCILCGKCIRADQELVVVGALDYLHRGFRARPATFLETSLEKSECTFCGACVTMCPTGALMVKGLSHQGTVGQSVATTCSYCGCGCAIWVHPVDNQIVDVTPRIEGSANQATLCVRGHYGSDYLSHPDRLRSPLIRKNGELQPAGWEEALDHMVQNLKDIADRWSPGAIGFFGSTQCTNEENYLFQKIARQAFGSPHVDNGARFHAISSITGLRDVLGIGASTNPLEDLEEARVILVLGAQPTESHPVASYSIKRAVRFKGARLIYASPFGGSLSHMAAPWLTIKPGSELPVIIGLIQTLIDEGIWRKDFLGEEPDGFASLREAVGRLDPASLKTLTGIEIETIKDVARIASTTRRCAIVFGAGISQSTGAVVKIRALANLALLLGCVGVGGGGIYALDRSANTQGACDMGTLPVWLPGYRSVTDPEGRAIIERLWGKEPPTGPGWSFGEMIKAAGSSELKALYVLGENPVGVLSRESLKALDGLEFLVVQDLFLTETASRAHVVLPGAGFAEKDGTFTSLERRIQRIRSAVKPPDEAKPDWWILSEILNRSGIEGEYDSAADVMGEISSVVPGYEGVKYSRLEGGGLFWPCPDERSSGETILHRGGLDQVRLGWEGEDPKGAVLEVDPEFPWLALRGETHFHCTGGSRSGRSRRLREYFSDCQVQLHPEDMAKLTLSQGDTARLISRKGEIKARAFASEEVPKGVVLMVPGLVGGAMGELIDWELDPLTKMPQLHAVSVRIEREGGEE